jgi:hypothetical protein
MLVNWQRNNNDSILLWFPFRDLYTVWACMYCTWAIFFLRHLANMSSMVPLWASTDSGFVPNLGPASEATPSGGGCLLYSLNDSCSHFTQRLFSLKLPQQHTCTIFSIHLPSSILIIHYIQTIFTSFYYETIIPSLLQFLLAGRLLSVFYVRYSRFVVSLWCARAIQVPFILIFCK